MQANTPFEERAAGFYNHSTKSDLGLFRQHLRCFGAVQKKKGGILHSNYAFEDPNHTSSEVQSLFRGALRS